MWAAHLSCLAATLLGASLNLYRMSLSSRRGEYCVGHGACTRSPASSSRSKLEKRNLCSTTQHSQRAKPLIWFPVGKSIIGIHLQSFWLSTRAIPVAPTSVVRERQERVETRDLGGAKRPRSTHGVTVVFAKD